MLCEIKHGLIKADAWSSPTGANQQRITSRPILISKTVDAQYFGVQRRQLGKSWHFKGGFKSTRVSPSLPVKISKEPFRCTEWLPVATNVLLLLFPAFIYIGIPASERIWPRLNQSLPRSCLTRNALQSTPCNRFPARPYSAPKRPDHQSQAHK
jgi:hypothetical protein